MGQIHEWYQGFPVNWINKNIKAKSVHDVFTDSLNEKKLIDGHRETHVKEKLKQIINDIYNIVIYAKPCI